MIFRNCDAQQKNYHLSSRHLDHPSRIHRMCDIYTLGIHKMPSLSFICLYSFQLLSSDSSFATNTPQPNTIRFNQITPTFSNWSIPPTAVLDWTIDHGSYVASTDKWSSTSPSFQSPPIIYFYGGDKFPTNYFSLQFPEETFSSTKHMISYLHSTGHKQDSTHHNAPTYGTRS